MAWNNDLDIVAVQIEVTQMQWINKTEHFGKNTALIAMESAISMHSTSAAVV